MKTATEIEVIGTTKHEDIRIKLNTVVYTLHLDANGFGVYGISKPKDEIIQSVSSRYNTYKKEYKAILPHLQDIRIQAKGNYI